MERKGLAESTEVKKPGEFATSSIQSFRQKMMEEEREEMAGVTKTTQEVVPPQTTAAANTGVQTGGLSFFQKLKTTGQEEAKSKLSMGFKRLPIWYKPK